MKLTIETVVKGLSAIAVNYTLEASEAYQDLIFEELEDKLTDEEFNKACKKIMFQESNSYNKMPNIGAFLKYASKQEKEPKDQADIEAERIIEAASYPTPTLTDNEFTNETMHRYGGIGKVYFDVHDSYNRNGKSRSWVKKELKDIWLACYDSGTGSNKASYPSGLGNCGVTFVGDKTKCLELLDSSTKLLEEPKNEDMDQVIAKLEEGWTKV